MLRIVGGEARGRRIKTPPTAGTRPTADRVREAIFSILYSRQASFELCLDLYAGSGALGIEALSRGEGRTHFVESDRAACKTISENLRLLGYEDRATLHCTTVAGLAAHPPRGAFTLLFADPPYALDGQEDEIAAVVAALDLAEDALLVYEHSKRRTPPERYARLSQVLTRRYGDSCITVYRVDAYAPGQETTGASHLNSSGGEP